MGSPSSGTGITPGPRTCQLARDISPLVGSSPTTSGRLAAHSEVGMPTREGSRSTARFGGRFWAAQSASMRADRSQIRRLQNGSLGEPRSGPDETGMLATASNAPAATQRARVAGVSIRLMLCPPAKSDPLPLALVVVQVRGERREYGKPDNSIGNVPPADLAPN